ncbi:hypothetical protein [Streptomyces sp. NPDC056492]|uniref:hypothetical protein n=1 Tax=unclassified Streptomyces TaxID=2593676 RepID=UPI0036760DAC
MAAKLLAVRMRPLGIDEIGGDAPPPTETHRGLGAAILTRAREPRPGKISSWGRSDESVITIEIRGHERAALDAAQRISDLFLSSGLCRLLRKPGEDEMGVLVHADVASGAGKGGYLDPEEAEIAGAFSVVNPTAEQG